MRRQRNSRGMTLIEVMASAVVMAFGLSAVAGLVLTQNRQNRRNVSVQQAEMIAQRTLEELESRGCVTIGSVTSSSVCGNLKRLDGTRQIYYWTVDGNITTVAPVPLDPGARQYNVGIDVDSSDITTCGPTGSASCLEGTETGIPAFGPDWVNVRVTVSWDEPSRKNQAVALQTRVAP